MKLAKHGNKLETNTQGESQEFGIGNASVVIEILRNHMYQHKVRTTVQEYICNARDAMREVGKGNNFEVTIPTQFNPVFKIRDFGPGITPDRMKDVFIMYGASTKRGDDVQTGGFGLGAKSAWSYTDSFTIVSVVDGTKRTYVAHTGLNNNGRLDHISTDETSEPNGTEIQIAVKRYDITEFRTSVLRAIYFWDEKPILKGETDPVTRVYGHKVSDLVEVIDKDLLPEYIQVGYDEDLAVVDGIPYPLPRTLVEKVKGLQRVEKFLSKKLVLHFGNGNVQMAASREAIADSSVTLAALDRLGNKATLEVEKFIWNSFAKVNSTSEYLRTYLDLHKTFEVDSFAIHGQYKIDRSFITSPLLKGVQITRISCLGARNQRVDKISKNFLSEGKKEISLSEMDNLFYTSKVETSIVQNKRIKEFFKNNTKLMLFSSLNGDVATFEQVIKDLGVKDFCSLTYTEVPKEQKVAITRDKREFCIHKARGGHFHTSLSENTQNWFYVSMDDKLWRDNGLKDLDSWLRESQVTKICALGERAISMVKGNGNFSSLKDWLSNFKPNKACVESIKCFGLKNKSTVATIKSLDGIEDEFLNERIKEHKKLDKSSAKPLPDMLVNLCNDIPAVVEFNQNEEKLEELLKNEYPLIEEIGQYSVHKEELIFYINAKYNSRKGK